MARSKQKVPAAANLKLAEKKKTKVTLIGPEQMLKRGAAVVASTLGSAGYCLYQGEGMEVTTTIAASAFIIASCMLLTAPLAQPQWYHDFADKRKVHLCGNFWFPNFLDVTSNIVFYYYGALGYIFCDTEEGKMGTQWETDAWKMFFLGYFFVGIGSTYYHWAPDDQTLIWDRLPITTAFMALISIVVHERVSEEIGEAILWPTAIIGALTVLYWHMYDDLRPYILIQFFAFIFFSLAMVFLPAKYSHTHLQALALVFYFVAKVFEALDKWTFEKTNRIISGHTIKHLFCGAAAAAFLAMVQQREPLQLNSA